MPRILCVSLNPAIDRRIQLPQFRLGEVNRAQTAFAAAGGKAAHVAFAAKALGAQVRWLAFLGGREGEACRAGVEAKGVDVVAVTTHAPTRMTLELIDQSNGQVTEVLEPGPQVTDAEREEFLQIFAREIRESQVVVLSGSLPRGLSHSFYAELVLSAKKSGCSVFLDTSGAALAGALSSKPDLIKPNRHEAEALLSRSLALIDDVIPAGEELHSRGIKTVVISLGSQGALAVGERVILGTAPKVPVVSTVGSGDCFLAGWAVATLRGSSLEDRMRLAIACGTANTLASSPGVLSPSEVERLRPAVEIQLL